MVSGQLRPITIQLVDSAGRRRKDTRTIKKQVRAIVKAVYDEEQRIQAKEDKDLFHTLKVTVDKFIDKAEPFDLLLTFFFFLKYYEGDKHSAVASLGEAVVDVGLLKTKTEAGVVAALLHQGLTEIPNIANLLDKITGGPGTVWEDFLKVIGLGGEV